MIPLYVVTDQFPYGSSEKTFIQPELSFLRESYDVSIISTAERKDKDFNKNDFEEQFGVKLYCYNSRSSAIHRKIFIFLCCFFCKEFWNDVKHIADSTENVKLFFRRIWYSYLYFFQAKLFSKWLADSELFTQKQEFILYSFWSNYKTVGAALLKCKYSKMKIITRMHRYDLYNEQISMGKRQPYKEYLDDAIDAILFVAKEGMDYYFNHFGAKYNSHKYFLCKLGTFPINSFPKPTRRESFHMVSCSALSPRKNVKKIAEALALIKDKKIVWDHFGGGIEQEKLFEVSKKCSSNIECVFHGNVNNELIRKFYLDNYIDCFITSSLSEGAPVSIMEAMSCGIPVIGTSVGDIPNMISGNGLLISSNPSPKEIFDAIMKVIDMNESEIEKMREKSVELWKANYSAETNTHELIRIINRL